MQGAFVGFMCGILFLVGQRLLGPLAQKKGEAWAGAQGGCLMLLYTRRQGVCSGGTNGALYGKGARVTADCSGFPAYCAIIITASICEGVFFN